MNCNDDVEGVAQLIYQTDPYIFPYLYDNDLHIAKKVIARMIFKDTIYNYKNITVALSGDKVEGIIISCKTPIVINYREMLNSFIESGIVVGERFARVYKEYYELLQDEPQGVYIANVCVAEHSRGKGIGKQMLCAFLNDKDTYHLETVKANVAALSLYKSVGFNIDCEYAGFTDVPCYRMTRHFKEE
jgi:hypothetical protein